MPTFRVPLRSRSFRGAVFVSSAALGLAGCATLPSSGPTGVEIRQAAAAGHYPFTLVEIDTPAALPPVPDIPSSALATMPPRPTDLIGPGDVLNITVYEAGVSLFGTALRTATAGGLTGVDTSSSAERLPAVRVDDYGYIKVPFVGRLRAAGHTAAELQSMIQGGLRGMSRIRRSWSRSNNRSLTV